MHNRYKIYTRIYSYLKFLLKRFLFFIFVVLPLEQSIAIDLHFHNSVGSKNELLYSYMDALSRRQIPKGMNDWFQYKGVDADDVEESPLDISFILEPPAGRHGYVMAKDDKFYFEDGKEARFWGINIVSEQAFPTHERAVYIAKRLAQMGVNIVRFHQLDNFRNNRLSIFGRSPKTTRTLDKNALDKFEYFWAQLKKRGIYLYLDLTTSRKVLSNDLNGFLTNTSFHIQGSFINELIDLQKEYARKILTHTNPYTKTQLSSDPCLALVLIQNEDSLFYLNKSTIFTINKIARNYLDNLFQEWLLKKYNPDLMKQNDSSISNKQISFIKTNDKVEFSKVWQDKFINKKHLQNAYEFLYQNQVAYFKEMKDYLRTLGLKVPIAGSNHWVDVIADLRANAEMDFVDRHKYWAHPRKGYSIEEGDFDKEPMIMDTRGGIIQNLAARRVHDRPYVVSEWNVGMGNEYQADAQIIMAVLASFQDWNVIEFETGRIVKKPISLRYAFGVLAHPIQIALWPVSALIFHRKEIKEAEVNTGVAINDKMAIDPYFKNPLLLDNQSFLYSKVGILFDQLQPYNINLSDKSDKKNRLFAWDRNKGEFYINTTYTQGVTGFVGGEKFSFDDLNMEIKTPYAALIVTSLTDKPIKSSSRLLVTAVARARNDKSSSNQNKGNKYNSGIFVEPVDGIIFFKEKFSCKIYSLSPSGERKDVIPIIQNQNSMSVKFDGNYRSMHYEIVKEYN